MELHVAGNPVFAYTGGSVFDASRPAIVFVHGAAHDHSVWALQSRWFGRHGHAVLAVDLPGHGRSGGEPLASIGELADWIVALLDAADLQQAILVGHSMGSLACLEAAARHPTRVAALALIGCAVPMAVSDALLAAARDTADQAYRMINQWSHAPDSLLGRHPVPGLWMPGASLALMERSRPGALHRDLANCNDYQGGLEAAAQVRCPTLLILGSRDLMTPLKVGKELAKPITNSRTAIIDGAGHAMMSEAPDAVLDALRGLMG